MNKLFTILLAFATALSFVGCHDNDDSDMPNRAAKSNPYLVTPERAMERLKEVAGDNATRSASAASVKTIGRNAFLPDTRANDVEDTPAIYIVDIPETGGCAVLAADTRLDPIYAILDNTKLEVGDLLRTPRGSSDDDDITTYVGGLINRAVRLAIRDSLPLRPLEPEDPRVPAAKGWDETTVIARQAPLLATKWDQGSPFNNNCPMEASDGNGNKMKSPAGCVTIALAQIMYYNRFPAAIDGIQSDWNLIRELEGPHNNLFYSPSARIEIANYIYTIAKAILVDFGNATKAKNHQAMSLLSRSGYGNVSLTDYAIGSVQLMVSTRKLPVYISGSDSKIEKSGHAWLIDGCNCYKVDSWFRTYSGTGPFWDYTDTLAYTKEYNLVHCNYGWGGTCDGYYSSGIFDTTSRLSDEDTDSSIGDRQSAQKYNFDTGLGLIMYTL